MEKYELNEFCRITQEHAITHAYVAPPIVLHLAKEPAVQNYDLVSLRMLTSGGAPLAAALIRELYQKRQIPVRQAYGLSETTSVSHIQVGNPPASQSNRLMRTRPETLGCIVSDLMAPLYLGCKPSLYVQMTPEQELVRKGSSGYGARQCSVDIAMSQL
jgi:acyl-coenzyme A synthetase/AMP-(fatty) acid ligase